NGGSSGSSSGSGDDDVAPPPADMASSMRQVNLYSAMLTNARARPGLYKEWLEEAGFEDIEVRTCRLISGRCCASSGSWPWCSTSSSRCSACRSISLTRWPATKGTGVRGTGDT
ncbi:hypothetical protein SEUCBS140593_008159, partial [Sporothrix eucalyptigena]